MLLSRNPWILFSNQWKKPRHCVTKFPIFGKYPWPSRLQGRILRAKHSRRMRQNLELKLPKDHRRRKILSLEQHPSVYAADFKTVSQVSMKTSRGLFSQRRLSLNRIYHLSSPFRTNENQRLYPPKVQLSAEMDETHRRRRPVSYCPGVRCQCF